MENKIQHFLDWFLIFNPSEQFLPFDDEGEIFTPTLVITGSIFRAHGVIFLSKSGHN